MLNNTPTDPSQALQALFSGLLEEQNQAFGTLRSALVSLQPLLQVEVQRLETKLGTTDARVQAITQSLQTNAAAVVELQAESESAQIRVPSVEPGGALLHGRVVDDARFGVGGLKVTLEDQQGKVVKDAGSVATDQTGFFAINLDQTAVTKLETEATGPLVVTVRDPNGKVLQRTEGVTVKANEQQFVGNVLQKARPFHR